MADFQIFGWKISNKITQDTTKQSEISSFVRPSGDDSIVVAEGGALGHVIDMEGNFKTEADLNFLAVRAMGWPAHSGGPGPWIRLKGQAYWDALSANYVSRFGPRFELPESWNLWFN